MNILKKLRKMFTGWASEDLLNIHKLDCIMDDFDDIIEQLKDKPEIVKRLYQLKNKVQNYAD